MKNQHETPEALAHTLFTAAQLAPGEGIEDAVGRLAALVEAQQPTHAQAGALESAEFGRFLSDVLTAAGLVTHGKQCKALGERLADMCAKLRHHGIKGGPHGTE